MNCHNPMSDNPQEPIVYTLPAGVPALTTFYLYLTSSCNLACRHCWITPEKCDESGLVPDSMDLEMLRSAIREAKPLGLSSVKLTGGEPVLNPQFCEILELLKAEQLQVVLESNGTLITPEIAAHLKKTAPDCFISISLDSSDPIRHDTFRGKKGAFKKAVDGISNLVSVGYMPQVIMSIYRGNLGEVEDLIQFASNIGVGSIKFNPVTSSGRGTAMDERDELLSYDEFLAFKSQVLGRLQQSYEIPLFIMMPPALVTISEILNRPFGFGKCNILGILGVLGTGELALCGIGRNIPELCFGRLGRDSIRDIWLNNSMLKKIRDVVEQNQFPGVCGNCIHAQECLMLCMAQNYLDFGDLVHPASLCYEAEKRGDFPRTRLIDME